ncbi:MAG: cysteine hydrolase [Flavobacteriaceae bacterium]|nr:cysteine hydrolase [Flavobacteriaceae bacterium]
MLKTTKTPILFWNVDTQVDFMKSDGKLYVQNAEEIEPTLTKLTAFAKENHIKVVNTCDYHNEKSPELSDNPDFVTTFPPHCMQHTEGQKFVKSTQPKNPIIFEWNKKYTTAEIATMTDEHRNIVIRKDLFDVFEGNPNTEHIVKALAPEKIFVYGVATNVCVDFAVKGLAERGYKVFVIKDAIKELPNIPTPFEDWKAHGIKCITASEIAKYC